MTALSLMEQLSILWVSRNIAADQASRRPPRHRCCSRSRARIQQWRPMSPSQISGNAGDSGDLLCFPVASGAPRDLLLHAGEIFRGDRPLEPVALLQALPGGGDVGSEILCQPDFSREPQRVADHDIGR